MDVRARRIARLALTGVVATVVGAAVPSGPSSASTSTVVVDLGATRQVMQGFGSSERVWIDPHLSDSPNTNVPVSAQRQILSSLYRRLGLTRVRNVLDAGVQPTPGASFDFRGKLADAHVAFVKQAQPYGLSTFFPGPRGLETWMTADDPDAYVDWAMAMLKRWRELGREPPLYAPLNEPEIAQDFPARWMHDVVLRLGRRMRAAGLRTKLVIPDDENPRDAYDRAVAVLEDPEARRYVAALAYHVYGGSVDDMVRMRELAARYRLPVWMTEFSSGSYVSWRDSLDWAERMHTLITAGGVSAIDYLWGFFGSWVRSDTMISIQFDGGTYRGFSYTPIYWITGQFSRFVRPGYRRVAATQEADGVLTTAYKGNGRVVVVAVNPEGSGRTVRFSIRGGTVAGRVAAVRSSEHETWRQLPAVALRRSGFTTELPPESVSTFVVAAKR